MKFKTAYNAIPEEGEVNNMPSMTIPDDTMSVAEIMERYARGLPIAGQKVPSYELSEEENEALIPADWEKLDISERVEFMEDNAARIAAMQKELIERREAANRRFRPLPIPAVPGSKEEEESNNDEAPK